MPNMIRSNEKPTKFPVSIYSRFFVFLSFFIFSTASLSCSQAKIRATTDKTHMDSMLLLSVESGEVFDRKGSLVHKFPGGYPLILENGEFITTDETSIYWYNRKGEILSKWNDRFTHDWDISENQNLFYLKRVYDISGKKRIRSTEIKVVDRRGKLKKTFNFFREKKEMESFLGKKLNTHHFPIEKLTKFFGQQPPSTCWEFEHINFLKILKNEYQVSENRRLPKGTIVTSLPFHQSLLALDGNTLRPFWSFELPGIHFFHTPEFTDRNTLVLFANNFRKDGQVIETSGIVEFDLFSGKEVFRYLLPESLYSPVNGSVQPIDEKTFLISAMNGEILLLDKERGLTPYLDLRKNYIDRKIDFYRATFLEKDFLKKTGIL